jgi:hypothetical protein
MGLHREDYEESSYYDYRSQENPEELVHKKKVKRLLEDRLERKRLKAECKDDLDELDAEFDWNDIER